jgi:hypothetical protein
MIGEGTYVVDLEGELTKKSGIDYSSSPIG